ncbi:MAG: glycosyl hydrolase 115 family protein [Bryobacterales bacterium]|nr:glycosyl hydrolase 115 family protein [Bryobacterales bacterium]
MRNFLAVLAGICIAGPLLARVELVSPGRTARIWIAPGEKEAVRIAVADLVRDVSRITGRTLAIVPDRTQCVAPCLAVETRPDGRWEAYRVAETPGGLSLTGSDERGTIYAVYSFCETYLGVDPLHFWTGREPTKRDRLVWDRVAIESGAPDFCYRGWFINDEDLLTEWKDGGGARHIDYPFYHQVTHPDLLERVFEAALRLRFNFIIPASFTDIANPAEERMVRDATRRGLMISMHHVEPMGVSAFAFQNYWKARGKSVPYTYHSQKAAFEEVWRWYASRWAKYPGVIWQLGLRGVADRPAWHHDPEAPKTDEARGRMISDAMRLQREIIRQIDPRPSPPMTTTLWMEGAELNRRGSLDIPPDVTVVFADNTPGWKMQADFHETPRDPSRTYGVYYHHAVWGWGPHLVQAVPPWKTQEILREATARQSSHYAVLNVSNVREFVLGIAATSRMLQKMDGFDGRAFLKQWCVERFPAAALDAEQAYVRMFESYWVDPDVGTPALLDGTSLAQGKRLFTRLLERIRGISTKPAARPVENLSRYLPNMPDPASYPLPKLLEVVTRQRADVQAAAKKAASIRGRLAGTDREFFENNFQAQQQILEGILGWLECAVRANLTEEPGARLRFVRQAAGQIERIRSGQALASRGMWKEWYRGDRKMNLGAAEKLTLEVLASLQTGEMK